MSSHHTAYSFTKKKYLIVIESTTLCYRLSAFSLALCDLKDRVGRLSSED